MTNKNEADMNSKSPETIGELCRYTQRMIDDETISPRELYALMGTVEFNMSVEHARKQVAEVAEFKMSELNFVVGFIEGIRDGGKLMNSPEMTRSASLLAKMFNLAYSQVFRAATAVDRN